jgi:hypothetical protein
MTSDNHDLSADLADYYRRMLATHTTNPEAGACPVCGVPRCPDWVDAFDRLASAGQLMTTAPPPWKPFHPGPRP